MATVWFGDPIAIGCGLVRGAMFLVARRKAAAAAGDPEGATQA